MAPPTGYVRGTHPEERRRLAGLNARGNRAALDALGPRPGDAPALPLAAALWHTIGRAEAVAPRALLRRPVAA